MSKKIHEKIENKRKEVREGQYRVQIYKFHPKAAVFQRKLILVATPIILLLIAIMFISPLFVEYNPETESNPINTVIFGLIIIVIGISVLYYLLVSPPSSCLTIFEEKLGEKNHHNLIEMLTEYLDLKQKNKE